MSDYKINIKIAGQLEKSLSSSIQQAQKTLGSMGNAMTGAGKKMTAGITTPLLALGTSSVKEFGEVDKSLKLVQATMGSTNSEAAGLESTIKKAAANSVFGMQDAADATLNYARQGFNAAQAGKMLTPALDLAAGTATDLSEVTSGLGNSLKMFKKDASYAATASDIFSKAQAQANTTVSDLFDAMSVAGPICNSVGWSMSDLAAITDIYGDAGITGSEGATALKTGLARLSSPAKDGAAWIEKLGLNIFDSNGQMKSMTNVQKQLHNSFSKLSSQEKLTAAAAIFGKNQMSKWLTLIDASPEKVQKYSSALESAEGTSHKMADSLLSGMGGSLEKLNSSFDVFKYNIGQVASQYLKPVVDDITKAIDAFNNMDPAMQKNIVKWAGIAAAVGPALLIFGKVLKVAGNVAGLFGSIGKAAGTLGKGMKQAQAPLNQGTNAMSAAAKNVAGFGAGFAMAAGGVWLLSDAAIKLSQAGPAAVVGLAAMVGGIGALMVLANSMGPGLQAGTQGLLAFGGAVLLASGGMAIMALAASQIAQSGPIAAVSLGLMLGGLAGLMAIAGTLGPSLTAASVGLLAFGGAILLAGAGCWILVQAATQIASAGTGAQVALAAMVGGLLVVGAAAGVMAPLLIAGAAGMAALGAALMIVSAGAMLGGAALLIISGALPMIAATGAGAATAIAQIGASMLIFAAGATVGGAAALLAAAGLLAFALGAGAAALVMAPLSAETAIVAAGVKTIADSAKSAGTGLKSMAASSVTVAAKFAILAAGVTPAAAAFAPFAAAVTLAAAGMMSLGVAATLVVTNFMLLTTTMAAISAGAPTVTAAFTTMATGAGPLATALTTLSGPLMTAGMAFGTFSTTLLTSSMALVTVNSSLSSVTLAVVTMTTTYQSGMTSVQTITTATIAVVSAGMNSFVAAITSGGSRAAASARTSATAIRTAFTSVHLNSAGAQMMNGLIAGINSKRGAVMAAARSVASAAASAVNSALKIHSPSRVLVETGQYSDEGLIKGFESKREAVKAAAVASMADPVNEAGAEMRALTVPQIEEPRTAVFREMASPDNRGSGKNKNDKQNEGAVPQIIFNPVYHFEGDAPKKEDIVEANRMSQAEFDKMMKEWVRRNGRIKFA